MPIVREYFWPEKLIQNVAEARNRTFAWGGFDSICWAFESVQLATGVDMVANLRATYSDSAGAASRISTLTSGGGVVELFHLIAQNNQILRVPLTSSQRGWLAVAHVDPPYAVAGLGIGIVSPEGDYVLIPASKGLQRVARDRWVVSLANSNEVIWDHTKCDRPKEEQGFAGLPFSLPFVG